MTTPAEKNSSPAKMGSHIAALDGVRGSAVLLVMIHHFAMQQEIGQGMTRIILRVCDIGWSGVDLFFVLSGFLITGILVQAKAQRNPLRTFYIRRTLRIFPLYYLSLVILIYVWPAFSSAEAPFVEIKQNQAWYWTYLTNVLIVFKIPMGEVNAAHFWSLAVEEQFYMVWPFVVLYASVAKTLRISVGMIIAAFAFRCLCYLAGWGHSPAYVLTISRMDALAMGALVALTVRDPARLASITPYIRKVAIGLVAIFVAVVLFQGSFMRGPAMLTIGVTALAGLFAILVGLLATGRQGFIQAVFENGFLRFFGKYSYSMYIIHPFLIGWIDSWFGTAFPSNQWWSVGLLRFILYTVIGLASASVVSLLVWSIYERWFLALKKYFEPKPSTVH